MVADVLGLPALTHARKITVDGRHGDRASGRPTTAITVLHGRAARGGQRGREDQRAALPVVQGDHGREEEAGDHAVASPMRASTPARSGWPTRSSTVTGPAQAARRGGEQVVTDEGDGGTKIAEFLAGQKLI